MTLTFAGELTKMIDAGLGRESAAPDTGVAVGRYSEYIEVSDAALASFETNAALPIRALTLDIEPIQEGTGDPSPENVRPITGRESAVVISAGKNIFKSTTITDTTNNVSFSYDGTGLVTLKRLGTSTSSSAVPAAALFSQICQWLKAGTYTLSCSRVSGTGNAQAQIYTVQNGGSVQIAVTSNTTTFTLSEDMNVSVRALVRASDSPDGVWSIQLEVGSAAAAYEPAHVQSVPFTFGQTVYGGVLDVAAGTLTITKAYVKDDTPADYGRNGATSYYLGKAAAPGIITPAGGSAEVISDRFKSANEATTPGVCFINPTGNIRFNTTAPFDDVPAMLAGIGVPEFVYLLAEPVVVELTPQQIETLIGTNNVWSDGGNVSLTYTKYNYTEGY